MKYFAEFTTEGERITTYVADGMPDTEETILLKHPKAVEISEEDQKKYLNGYIRGLNGKPELKQEVNGEKQIDIIRRNKVEELKTVAKHKLMDTDHDIVEYFELKNLTDEEFEDLKKQRQAIRDLRDSLIKLAIDLNDADAIEEIAFK